MRKPEAPCLGCTEETGRSADPNCHGYCEKYITFRKALDKRNEEDYIQKQHTMDANGIEARRIMAVKSGKIYRRGRRKKNG